jgi:hypothetical protein
MVAASESLSLREEGNAAMGFATALAAFRETVPVEPIPELEFAVPDPAVALFITIPTPIVTEADLDRAMAQEGV